MHRKIFLIYLFVVTFFAPNINSAVALDDADRQVLDKLKEPTYENRLKLIELMAFFREIHPELLTKFSAKKGLNCNDLGFVPQCMDDTAFEKFKEEILATTDSKIYCQVLGFCIDGMLISSLLVGDCKYAEKIFQLGMSPLWIDCFIYEKHINLFDFVLFRRYYGLFNLLLKYLPREKYAKGVIGDLFIKSIQWGFPAHKLPENSPELDKYLDVIGIDTADEVIKIEDEIKVSFVKILLENNISAISKWDGMTPFKLAVISFNLDLLQLMIAYNFPWEGSDNQVSLKDIIKYAKEEIFDNLKFFSTYFQLYLLDRERAIKENLIYEIEEVSRHCKAIKDLFEAVKQGSKIAGNMSIVKKNHRYISLGLVDEDQDTLFDIAIKNRDRAMLLTLMAQDKDSMDALFKKNWRGKTPLDDIIEKSKGSVDIIRFLTYLAK